MKRLSKKEVRAVQEFVSKRDRGRCVLHTTANGQVHEILQRSSSAPRSARVFQPKYMACLCPQCHYDVHHGGKKIEVNGKVLKTLMIRFGYKYPRSVLEKFRLV